MASFQCLKFLIFDNYFLNSNRNERKKQFMAKSQPIKKNRESIWEIELRKPKKFKDHKLSTNYFSV